MTVHNHSRHLVDVAIIGGGLVGASLARAMAHLPIRIALVEAVGYRSNQQPSFDDRIIALSECSRRIFANLGLWQKLASHTTPIHSIHVGEQGRFGITRIRAAEEKVAALGYVITARTLGEQLVDGLELQKNLTLLQPATVVGLELHPEQAKISLLMDERRLDLECRLVVAADGGDSSVRQQLGLPVSERDYRQTAIVANVACERPHQGVAYERFTRQGPMAMLPIGERAAGLVWTLPTSAVDAVLGLSDAEFLVRLQDTFGDRLGTLQRVGARHTYPLRLLRALEFTRHRLALIGNAAHTLHPVAGQGFNLGIRDAAVMADVLEQAVSQHIDPGSDSVLDQYADWRYVDQRNVIGFTDALVQTFSNNLGPLALARNLGLLATDLCPPLKHHLAKTSMGLAGRLPKLALV